ncbi:hypothetical protein [Rhizobium lentis]|uniref:hypothetical protein n=1 Tax=Rhizobium lentis TaxID=1138194 RepID=UPI001C840A23|nr:hypothetical protein [Rhizobium lentis]MBX5145381.1 hypothetical protein [Rhizobium lentis]
MSLPSIPPVSGVISLPATSGLTAPMLTALTQALGVPREVLAADDQIEHAWANLPRLLDRIPAEHRSETLVRMCVAVATGLFDSAINYAWNAAIIELREKVRRFGLTVVPQVTGKSFDERTLLELKDADLLSLCLRLNLIAEEGYYLLDQCRDIRNNFSAAHPSMGALDETEFLAFLNRCAKHALSTEKNPRGVDIQGFIAAVKGTRFNAAQLTAWVDRLAQTFDAQRELLIGTLHGIYCDPAAGEEARVNALWVCERLAPTFSPRTKSDLVDRHHDYLAKGDEPRHKASQLFFERLSLLSLLGETELHALVTSASHNLMSVHNAFNNFYNEPPFAERLNAITSQNRVPESAQFEFVSAVVTCATGNQWGVSNAAVGYYNKMVRSFSPNEIRIMLSLVDSNSIVRSRIVTSTACKKRFADLVRMLDPSSVPANVRPSYDAWAAFH